MLELLLLAQTYSADSNTTKDGIPGLTLRSPISQKYEAVYFMNMESCSLKQTILIYENTTPIANLRRRRLGYSRGMLPALPPLVLDLALDAVSLLQREANNKKLVMESKQ